MAWNLTVVHTNTGERIKSECFSSRVEVDLRRAELQGLRKRKTATTSKMWKDFPGRSLFHAQILGCLADPEAAPKLSLLEESRRHQSRDFLT